MSPTKLIALALLVLGLSTGSAAATSVEGRWSMALAPGSQSVVRDGVGGSDLVLRGSFHEVRGAVGRAIDFNFQAGPAFGTARRSGRFDPGHARFAVAAYLTTPRVPADNSYSPNVMQKGLYQGGQWKLQLKGGPRRTIATCRFKGTTKGDTVEDRSRTRLDDRHWHEVVCWRLHDRYGITVDGASTVVRGSVGAIRSAYPLRVGNKLPTAGVEDQFKGRLDCIAYVTGHRARAIAERRVPC